MKNNLIKDSKNVANALILSNPHATVYTFGNGGSSSIADHMACDWMKLTGGSYMVQSLSSNSALLSAIANDLGYENVCSAQLKWRLFTRDVVVLISSSGNSPNIIKAAEFAKKVGAVVIGFSGSAKNSKGGLLKQLCDLSVHSPSNDYGEIEDYHSNVMHQVARILTQRKDSGLR